MAGIAKPNVCILLGPHFIRLAASAGFTYGFFESSEAGRVPIPDHIKGVSTGGIVAASFGPWTEKASKAALSKVKELKGSDFYGLNKELELWGGLEAIGALSPLIPWQKIENKWLRNAAKAAAATTFVGLEGAFIHRLFVCQSVFSNDKLLDLLMRFIDFKGLFNSKVKIEIIAANLNGDKTTGQRVKLSSVTNFRPEDKNSRKFAMGILSSASVTGFFPTRTNDDGDFITDGGIYSAFPVDLAYRQGCDVIIVVRLRYVGQNYIEHDYSKWMSALHRSMDIVIDDRADHILAGYVSINNDVTRIKEMKTSLQLMQRIMKEVDADARGLIEQEMVKIETNLSGLTAHDKKFINLVMVDSEEIPPFSFRQFNRESNIRGENIGYDAFRKSEKDIIRAIEFAQDNM